MAPLAPLFPPPMLERMLIFLTVTVKGDAEQFKTVHCIEVRMPGIGQPCVDYLESITVLANWRIWKHLTLYA